MMEAVYEGNDNPLIADLKRLEKSLFPWFLIYFKENGEPVLSFHATRGYISPLMEHIIQGLIAVKEEIDEEWADRLHKLFFNEEMHNSFLTPDQVVPSDDFIDARREICATMSAQETFLFCYDTPARFVVNSEKCVTPQCQLVEFLRVLLAASVHEFPFVTKETFVAALKKNNPEYESDCMGVSAWAMEWIEREVPILKRKKTSRKDKEEAVEAMVDDDEDDEEDYDEED